MLLNLAHLLQSLVLALSIFNLTTFLWLALTVWLNGNRHAGVTRLGVVGLGLSALFFYIHALLISSPLTLSTSFPTLDFWWRMIWLPALGVPYLWFAIGLHYAALISPHWRRRRPLLLIISGALGLVLLLLLLINRDTFTYIGALSLLSSRQNNQSLLSPLLLIPVLFLIYVTFCAIGPWFTLGRISRLGKLLRQLLLRRVRGGPRAPSGPLSHRTFMEAFWDDPVEVDLLEEPQLSWHLARPALLLAALLTAGLTTTLGVLVAQSIFNWLGYGANSPVLLPTTPLPPGSAVPFNLLILDLLATGSVSLAILLIGYSIVRHGVLIERPLARRGFFEQWRGVVIVSTLVAILISVLVALTRSTLGGLLLITCLATGAYALFTWSSYTAHDRYVALLGPFMRSANQRHWLNTDLPRTEMELEHLFFHLCHDVLGVRCASLSILAGAVRRTFSYRWPTTLVPGPGWIAPFRSSNNQEPRSGGVGGEQAAPARRIQVYVDEQPMVVWVLPIYNERGLVATLYLGPRADGGVLTDEDMNLAHACGQRILDTLGDHESMQAVAGLLRRRIVDVKLLGAQQRRVLHDEILPQMHLALLRLETLRSLPENVYSTKFEEAQTISPPLREQQGRSGCLEEQQDLILQSGNSVEMQKRAVDEAIAMISTTHRRLAAMMRATAPGAPHRLEHEGLMNAISTMLEQDFQQAFDEVEWEVPEETAAHIDEVISPAIAELIFAAVQEALRNAARHARGADIHRPLRLTLKVTWNPYDPQLEVLIADNGVGIASAASTTTGTGGGLLTHSALLAIAGGSLNIHSTPGEGVTVRISLPTDVLR